MLSEYNPYTLPTIEFVGGETQDLRYNLFKETGKSPYSLSGCTSTFSMVSYTNKNGEPVITKAMRILEDDKTGIDNVLSVVLTPQETVGLSGKYIYQITIEDGFGNTEIPKQGIIFIVNNIHKSLIK